MELSDILSARFSELNAERPSFSVRALARRIGISPTYVSQVLNGKRELPQKRVLDFAQALNFSPEETAELINRTTKRTQNTKNALKKAFVQLEKDKLELWDKWYMPAILDLTFCKDFQPDTQWITKRLGIGQAQTKEAIKTLKRLGLLDTKNDNWTKTKNYLKAKTDKSFSTIRAYHKSLLKKTIDLLENHNTKEDFDRRSVTGVTMAIDPDRVEDAKDLIVDFKQKMASLLTQDKDKLKDVYHLGIFFIPLTKNQESDAGDHDD